MVCLADNCVAVLLDSETGLVRSDSLYEKAVTVGEETVLVFDFEVIPEE